MQTGFLLRFDHYVGFPRYFRFHQCRNISSPAASFYLGQIIKSLASVSGSSHFYPRDAMLARVFAIATCLSVRLSVCLSVRRTPVLCLAERKQDREMYTV